MSDLVCVAYDKPDTADVVLNELRMLTTENVIDLEGACVGVRDENGEVHLKQSVDLVAMEVTITKGTCTLFVLVRCANAENCCPRSESSAAKC